MDELIEGVKTVQSLFFSGKVCVCFSVERPVLNGLVRNVLRSDRGLYSIGGRYEIKIGIRNSKSLYDT